MPMRQAADVALRRKGEVIYGELLVMEVLTFKARVAVTPLSISFMKYI